MVRMSCVPLIRAGRTHTGQRAGCGRRNVHWLSWETVNLSEFMEQRVVASTEGEAGVGGGSSRWRGVRLTLHRAVGLRDEGVWLA